MNKVSSRSHSMMKQKQKTRKTKILTGKAYYKKIKKLGKH
jgi:hypothetical protein